MSIIKVIRLSIVQPLAAIVCSMLTNISQGQPIAIKNCISDTEEKTEYCIASDSFTHDDVFGESYRLFLVRSIQDTLNYQGYYLDVNTSPDFPYDLYKDYLDQYGLVVIQGYTSFYLYSKEHQKLSKYITPDYTECSFSDQQGMMIQDLVIKEKGTILELKVRECGLHRFAIQDVENISQIK